MGTKKISSIGADNVPFQLQQGGGDRRNIKTVRGKRKHSSFLVQRSKGRKLRYSTDQSRYYLRKVESAECFKPDPKIKKLVPRILAESEQALAKTTQANGTECEVVYLFSNIQPSDFHHPIIT